MPRSILALCLLAGLTGCSEPPRPACAPGLGSAVAVFTLLLGKAIPGRTDLTDAEWQSILDTTVTATLPNGYTLYDGSGGWMNPITHRTIQEGTKILLVALPDVPASLAAINRIRTDYQARFHQQLVGMIVAPACATF